MSFVSITAIFFFMLDPLGNLKWFQKTISYFPEKMRLRWALIDMIYGLLVITFFTLVGQLLLSILNISKPTVSVATAAILFLSAIRILFANPEQTVDASSSIPRFVPIAVPMIARPSFITTILLYSEFEDDFFKIVSALLISWLIAVSIYLNHAFLMRILKKNGLKALERLIGMVLVMISIQRLLEGIKMVVIDLS